MAACGGVSMETGHKRQEGLVNSFTTTIYEQSSAVCFDTKEKFVKVKEFTPYEPWTDSSQELFFFPKVKARHVLEMHFANKEHNIHRERALNSNIDGIKTRNLLWSILSLARMGLGLSARFFSRFLPCHLVWMIIRSLHPRH